MIEDGTSDLDAFVQLEPEQEENSDFHTKRTLSDHTVDSDMIYKAWEETAAIFQRLQCLFVFWNVWLGFSTEQGSLFFLIGS